MKPQNNNSLNVQKFNMSLNPITDMIVSRAAVNGVYGTNAITLGVSLFFSMVASGFAMFFFSFLPIYGFITSFGSYLEWTGDSLVASNLYVSSSSSMVSVGNYVDWRYFFPVIAIFVSIALVMSKMAMLFFAPRNLSDFVISLVGIGFFMNLCYPSASKFANYMTMNMVADQRYISYWGIAIFVSMAISVLPDYHFMTKFPALYQLQVNRKYERHEAN